MIDLFESLVYGVATAFGHVGSTVIWLAALLFVATLSYMAFGPVSIPIALLAYIAYKNNRRR